MSTFGHPTRPEFNFVKGGFWVALAGLIVAIIGVTIAYYGWQDPKPIIANQSISSYSSPSPPLADRNAYKIAVVTTPTPSPTPVDYGKILTDDYAYPLSFGKLYLGMPLSEAQHIFADMKTEQTSTGLTVYLDKGPFKKIQFSNLIDEYDPQIYEIVFWFRDNDAKEQTKAQAKQLFTATNITKKVLNNIYEWDSTDETTGERVSFHEYYYQIEWNE